MWTKKISLQYHITDFPLDQNSTESPLLLSTMVLSGCEYAKQNFGALVFWRICQYVKLTFTVSNVRNVKRDPVNMMSEVFLNKTRRN
jgi:hypothetical protein